MSCDLRYKETYLKDAAEISEGFCQGKVISEPAPEAKRSARASGNGSDGKKKKNKKKEKGKENEKKTSQNNGAAKGASDAGGMPSMEEMLKKYDTDGSISNLIEMERESPELMLEPAELEEVQSGANHLRCDVCRAATTVAHRRAKKLRARDEERLNEVMSGLCLGTPEGSAEYPKYPGNPPLWGEMYSVSKAGGR